MGFLIDTSVLIAAERGRCSLADLVCDLAGESLALAAITASELLHGVHRAIDPNVAEKRSRFVEYILDLFPVLPFDLETRAFMPSYGWLYNTVVRSSAHTI